MVPQLQGQSVSVVLRGTFNAAMFHPSWLSSQGLIRPEEAEAAEVELVHPQLTRFSSGWLNFTASTDRLQARTAQEPYYEVLRDLVVGILSVIAYTPVTLLGINSDFEYRFESQEAWNQIGHILVPKVHWDEVLDHPGMRAVEVEGLRPDDLEGYIRVRVEPTSRRPPAIHVSVNDHHVLSSPSDTAGGAAKGATILSDHWTDSMERGKKTADKIASLGGANG